MDKVAVLGSTGMIGSGLTRALSEAGHNVVEFNRSGRNTYSNNEAIEFNIVSNPNFECLTEFDYVINAIGLIRHKINSSSSEDVTTAIEINSLFPQQLDQFSIRNNIKIFQIGTDCIYSGRVGSYLETSNPDPIDIYGYSKTLGEAGLLNTCTLRVSVIGNEVNSSTELKNWVEKQPAGAHLKGFSNHFWNGVTPLQLGEVISAIIRDKSWFAGTQHLVPADKVSKLELIRHIATQANRNDLVIEEFHTGEPVDRSLSTINIERNLNLWRSAGYDVIPTIKEMVVQYNDWLKPNR